MKLSLENLLHPFQPFVIGQFNYPPRIASKMDIKLIFYGENGAEYGNPVGDNATSLRDKSFFVESNVESLYFSGISVSDLVTNHNIAYNSLAPYLPISSDELARSEIEVHFLGYYLKWVPQEAYYYAAENTGFKASPFRTQGTYNKYNSIDDKVDDLHYYTTYIKFGIGRTTYDSSQEVRNKHMTRDEAKSLVGKYDGEYPSRYLTDILDFIGMSEDHFKELCDEFRSPHLWKQSGSEWHLRHTVNKDGVNDT